MAGPALQLRYSSCIEAKPLYLAHSLLLMLQEGQSDGDIAPFSNCLHITHVSVLRLRGFQVFLCRQVEGCRDTRHLGIRLNTEQIVPLPTLTQLHRSGSNTNKYNPEDLNALVVGTGELKGTWQLDLMRGK